jgi:tetraacyldisaccharide 4'-kinase
MSLARTVLAPAGALYGAAGRLRHALYARGVLPRARLAGRVISVGNLGLGGSGKTPVVALIADMLREASLPVAVLSRGYGGSFRGEALIVSDGREVHAAAPLAGDEPVMLARRLRDVVVAVGRRRDRVGRVVEERFGPRVHVLDDGFQHLRLHRDLDVLCATPADLEDRPLPAGRLREFASAAARADVLLLSDDGSLPATDLDAWPRERVFRLRRRVEGFFDADGQAQEPPARPFLLAGIARPERFAGDVRRLVREVAGQRFFADHHPFGREDLGAVEAQARAAGADAVVTTAKDAERLPPEWRPLPVRVMRIAAEVDDPERFRRLLLAAAREAA